MEGRLKVEVLGQFRLSMGGAEIKGTNTPRMRALLGRLLLSAGRNVDRGELAFTLWPDSTEARARGSLRKLLYHLGQHLPDLASYLAITDQTLSWRADAPATVDLLEFERLSTSRSRAERRAAADLYAGPLLPGAYEQWVLDQRDHIAGRFIDLVSGLADGYEERGEFLEAATWIERLVASEPTRETAWERLVALYAAAGERGRALAAFDRCREALAEELAVEPGPRLEEARDRLLVAGPPDPPNEATSTRPTLIGRDEELRHLRGIAHDALRHKRPLLLLVEGEAGLGKSSLADELRSWAASQGHVTHSTRAYEPDRESPFAPLRHLLRSADVLQRARRMPARNRAALAHLAPVLAEAPTWAPATEEGVELGRRLLLEALTEVLFPSGRPALFVADDLQWWDGASLAWLQSLLRGHAGPLIIATLRTEAERADALHSLLATLEANGVLERFELAPLGPEATAQLLDALAPTPMDPKTAARLHEETEGNPLFIAEWVDALSAGVLAEAREYEGYLSALSGIPRRVHGLITGRLLALTAGARGVAEAGAVLGRTFGWAVVQAMMERPDAELVDALDELCRRRVLNEAGPARTTEPSYGFTHGLIRDVIESRLSAARRRYLNDRAARALVDLHGNDEAFAAQIGEHLARAGRPIEAARSLAVASRRAKALYANDQALSYQDRALELLKGLPSQATDSVRGSDATADPSPAELRLELLQGKGEVLRQVGRHGEAAGSLTEAQQESALLPEDPLRDALLRMSCGNVARDAGDHAAARIHYQAAEELAERSLAGGDETRARPVLLQVRSELLNHYYRLGLEEEMVRVMEELAPLARSVDDAHARLRYHHTLILLAHRRNRFRTSDTEILHAKEALIAAEETGDAHAVATARFGWGFVQLWAFDLDEAERHLSAGLKGAELTGDLLLEVRALTYLGVVARLRGDVVTVREIAARTLALAEGVGGSLEDYVGCVHAQWAWSALQDGRFEDARAEALRALALWEGSAFPFKWLAGYPLLSAALRVRDPAAAEAAALTLLDPLQQPLVAANERALEAGIAAWRRADETAAFDAFGRVEPRGVGT